MRDLGLDPLLDLLAALEIEDYLLLGAVLLLPWAFGGVELWAHRSAALLLAGAAAAAVLKEGWQGLGLGRRARWLLPAFLLALWAAVQILPLPPFALRLLSPEADRIYARALPGYRGPAAESRLAGLEARALEKLPEVRDVPLPGNGGEEGFELPDGGSGRRFRSISVQPSATQERLFWYVALLLGFLIVRRRVSDPEVARVYRAALFGLFAALAVFGLAQMQAGSGKIYGLRSVPSPTFFGPYVNPSHFAGVMEIAVPWLAGYAWSRLRHSGWSAFREARFPLALGAALLCLAAALASASRTAALLLGVSPVVLALIAVRRWRWRLAVLGGAVAAWGLVIAVVAGTTLGDRIQSYVDRLQGGLGAAEGRTVAWRACLPIVADFPLTGTGFGTFREVFPRYMPPGESALWRQAHNDYLEVLLDGGAIAGILLLWLIWGFWSRVLRRTAGLSTVGLVLGIASLSVHAFVEFNHQTPANALIFVTACALALGRDRLEARPS